MSWFVSALYDRVMAPAERACLVAWRQQLLAPLAGRVLEIGAGTGANLPHYPHGLEELVVTEPDRHMRAKLDRAASRSLKPPRIVDASADSLPFADGSFDAVVATLVLCTVRAPERVLAEVFRVLKPGGKLVFLEHVAAEPHSTRFVWQRRIDPVWKHLAGGCRVTRRTLEAIEATGFVDLDVKRDRIRKAPAFVRPSVRGTARKPGYSAGNA